MKHLILSVFALIAAISADAQKVIIDLTSGETVAYDASEVSKIKFVEDSHEYVDLGLSVLWATCNVGADNCYDYGDYFAWGETTGYNSGKTSFSWDTYFDTTDGGSTFSKYSTSAKTVLDKEDDAAYANWGGKWRMPTGSELQVLCNTKNCIWTWYDAGNSEFNGVAGYKVQSLKQGYTDKYIFLPAAGYLRGSSLSYAGSCGYYWSSSLGPSYSASASFLYFKNSDCTMDWDYGRYVGRCVRPVTDK